MLHARFYAVPARVRLNTRGHELVIRKDSVALMRFDSDVGYNVITPSLSRQEVCYRFNNSL